MNEGPSQSRYPKGVKICKTVQSFVELDLPLSDAKDNDIEFKFTLNKGITKREALQKAHWNFTKFWKQVDGEALTQHRDSLKPLAAKARLKEACRQSMIKMQTDLSEDLGLDQTTRPQIDARLFDEYAEESYRKIVTESKKKR